MSDRKQVFLVLTGQYEVSIECVFSDEGKAERFANDVIGDGEVWAYEIDEMDMPDYPFRVSYHARSKSTNVYLDFSRHSVGDNIVYEGTGYYHAHVCAPNRHEAERIGKGMILKHMRIEGSETGERTSG